MRKWRCVSVNEENRYNFTVGKIYETDDKMLNCKTDNGYVLTSIKIIEKGDAEMGLVFEEIKEEEKKVNKFKVGDKVRILDGSKIKDYRGGWAMSEFIGETGIIKKVMLPNEYSSESSYEIKDLKNNEYNYMFDERGLELVKQSPTKTITITTSDSTTTLTDGIITVLVNRYYADKHDEEVAVNLVVDKYYDELEKIECEKNTPKVGDKVRVVDSNDVYPNYRDWLITNNVSIRTALKWKDNNKRFTQTEYKVVAIHPHSIGSKSKRMLALIEGEYEAFIIGIEGLEVIK